MKTKIKKLYEFGKNHIIDTTAILTVTNPLYAAFENILVGMPDDVALKARGLASLTAYLGMGSLLSKGRDFSRKKFKINDTTPEKIQLLHDTVYMMAMNVAIAPVMYTLSGASPKQTLFGTLSAMGLSLVSGGIMGYGIDLFRDLTGIKKSERIPRSISNLKSKAKKGLVGLLVGASIGACGLVYHLTPDKKQEPESYQIEKAPIKIETQENKTIESYL